jgi:ferrochelatase
VPAITCVAPYYDDRCYVAALAKRIRAAIEVASPDHVVLSFHGLPERYVTSGDPYREHCDRTVAELTRAMGWKTDSYTVAFQSRFGPEKWLGPATAEVLKALPARGIRRPLVVAPGFTTDCLETLDELGHEGRAEFAAGGGDPSAYALCPCLNDDDGFMQALARLVTAQAATKP